MAKSALTRRTITWSKETDMALQDFLGSESSGRGGFSKFIEDAVRWRIFDQTVQTIKRRNESIDPAQLQGIVDNALREVRHEMAREESQNLAS